MHSLPCLLPVALLGCLVSASAQAPFCVAQDVELAPASLTSFESYGRSVALDVDRAAIGAATSRRVAIWSTDGALWSEETVLQPLTAGAGWGTSVALSGNLLAVGAPFDSAIGGVDAGSVTVFDFSGNSWTEVATLTPSDPFPGRRFGETVAVRDGLIAVGAPGDEVRGVEGVVYVFSLSQGQWLEEARLTPISGGTAGFGRSLALDPPRLLVGSPATDRVHAFNRVLDVWSEGAGLAQAGSGAGFGWSLALSGDRALIGAPFDDTQGTNAGAVTLWQFTGIFWVEVESFYASDAIARDGFGVSVAFDRTRFVVGASGASTQGSTGTVLAAGHAYLFAEANGTWLEQARFTSSAAASGDFFARALDFRSDVVLVGSPGSDASGALSGSASIFRLGASEATFGTGVAGTDDFVPAIAASNCAAVSQTFDLEITDGLAGALGILIWSERSGSLPFAGGEILTAFPLLNAIGHVLAGPPGVGGAGTASFPIFVDSPTVLGQRIVLQTGYLDPGALAGFSLSRGVEFVFPAP